MLHLVLLPGRTAPELRGKQLPIPSVLDLSTLTTCARLWFKVVAADHGESIQYFEKKAEEMHAEKASLRMTDTENVSKSTMCDKATLQLFKTL